MADDPSTIEVALDGLADFAELVGQLVGAVEPRANTVAQLAALSFRTASGAVRIVEAAELAEIQRQRAIGQASGASARHASKQNFAKRCATCSTTETACNLAKMQGGPDSKCCPDCSHPAWWP